MPRKNKEDNAIYGKKYYEEHKEEIKEKRKSFEYVNFPNIRKLDIGNITEAKFLAKFLGMGLEVSKPFSGHARYDYIIEDPDGSLFKVQCKTGRLRSSCVRFQAASPAGKYDKSQIDLFAVYCPDNDGYYIIPVDLVTTKTEFSIRVSPPIRDTNPNSQVIDAEPFII